MSFSGLDPIAILASAVAGFVFGAVYYSALGKQWMASLSMKEQPKPDPKIFITAFLCQAVMATVLHGLTAAIGRETLVSTLQLTLLVWVGLVVAPMIVNHRFQSQQWRLTAIDAGHWLGVLVLMAIVQHFL